MEISTAQGTDRSTRVLEGKGQDLNLWTGDNKHVPVLAINMTSGGFPVL